MSEPEPGADHAYFRAIEDLFIALRGAPLLLSPADWQVARRWQRDGVPLELVRRILEEVFERRRERGAHGKVMSLRYCAHAVEEAWEEVRELTAPGERGEGAAFDVAGRLATLAAALPPDLPGRAAWGERITAAAGELGETEEALTALDHELVGAVAAATSEEAREALEQEVATTLTALADRLPAAELERARGELSRRALRRRVGLPVLSLFSPEAEPPAGKAGEGGGEG